MASPARLACGAAAPASTFTTTLAEAERLRSSVTVAVTVIGPAPASRVESIALNSRGEMVPRSVVNAIVIGRLSGLLGSQVMFEVSPTRTVLGTALHASDGAMGCGPAS